MPLPQPHLLVVDDSITNRSLLFDALTDVGYQVTLASNGATALELAQALPVDLVLLDVLMQGMSGFETCRFLRANPATQDVPVIFITGIDDTESKLQGWALGAVDYITKPFEPQEAIARIGTHLRLCRFAKALEQQNQQLRIEVEQREQAEAKLRLLNAELLRQRDLAQVTLNAIGDAVIATDDHGCIQTFNPVAEYLTGWRAAEALARPLSEIFRVVDEDTRQPLPNLVDRVLQGHDNVSSAETNRLLLAADGDTFAIHETASPIRAVDGSIIGVVLVFRDVTQVRQLVKQLAWQASYDSLTQLVNRREFEHRLELAIATNLYTHHTLCFVDLDNFKQVNDSCGHAAGDDVLQQVSQVLQTSVRKTDLVSRIGGDEFAVLLYGCDTNQAQWIVQNLCQNIAAHPFQIQDRAFQLGASVGLVEISTAVGSTSQWLNAADAACYEAKRRGGNQIYMSSGMTS